VEDMAFIHDVINRELQDLTRTAQPSGPAW
jgi:hypothetical protein